MWIENFRQFVSRSLWRISAWARSLDLWPAWLIGRSPDSPERALSTQLGLAHSNAPCVTDSIQVDWHADVSYRFRSLHCHMRVRILEPTPGMKFIYQALQRLDEA